MPAVKPIFVYNIDMMSPIYVLIVEDAVDLGKMLKSSIQALSEDLSINIVPSAEEGFLEAGRHEIHLLVTDFRLPGISGLELVRRVRKRHPKVKVILTSAVVDDQLKQEANELKVDQYLLKPVDLPLFVSAVKTALNITTAEPVLPAEPPKSPEKPSKPAREEPDEDLGKVLSTLRDELHAFTTMLVDERGHITARSGDIPVPTFELEFLPQLMSAISAGQKAARLLESPRQESVQVYSGRSFDLLISPLVDLCLLTATRPSKTTAALFEAGEKVLIARNHLFEIMGTPLVVPAQVKQASRAGTNPVDLGAAPGQNDQELETLLKNANKVKKEEADQFWEKPSVEPEIDLGNPNVITYEQAKKMGLDIKKEEKK